MNNRDEAWQVLARRMCGGQLAGPEEMEALFVPMIRVAMRTGRGQPVLVDWVARSLPEVAPSLRPGDKVDPEWAAPRMARLLCAQMLQKVRGEGESFASRETIVDR